MNALSKYQQKKILRTAGAAHHDSMSASDSERGAWESNHQQKNANSNAIEYTDFPKKQEEKNALRAVSFNRSDKPLLVSKQVLIAKSFKQLSVVCEQTGIVSLLDIPALPGKTLVYDSPFASVANCRGIVQAGRQYLAALDMQILAGLFLCLAGNYELFRSHNQSAAENNAIIRGLPKDLLIEALVVIEDWIHSGNSVYVPKISLLYDSADTRNTLSARFVGWLSSVVEALAKPDTTVYDENKKPEKIVFKSVAKVSVAQRKEVNEKSFARKLWNMDKKNAKDLISTIPGISSKFKNYLTIMFTNDGLLQADRQLVSLMIQKLEQQTSSQAMALVLLLKKDRSILIDNSDPFADVEPKEQKFADIPIGATLAENRASETSAGTHQIDQSEQQNADSEAVLTPEPDYTGMTAIQKVLAKKKWQKENAVALGHVTNVNHGFDASKQIVLPHVYVPAESGKIKEAQIASKLQNEDDALF